MWTDESIENVGSVLKSAIREGDCATIRTVVEANPWVVSDRDWKRAYWMEGAVAKGRLAVVKLMRDLGFNLHVMIDGKSTLLTEAIHCEHDDIVDFLLAEGVDPKPDRTLIAAMNVSDPQRRMRYVRQLVEHGVDVNKLLSLFGDHTKLFTALDGAESFPEVAVYLKEHGAKTAKEIQAEQGSAAEIVNAEVVADTGPANPAIAAGEAVIAYFREHVGVPDDRQIIEIVRTGHPIAIHIIKPQGDRKHLTLFTTGLSVRPMQTPPGEEAWQFAELFMELPGDWPVQNIDDPTWNWPVVWLRQVAQYPHDNGTWLGGPVTIFAPSDPPQPLAPNVRFTSLLLLAEHSFVRPDGQTVHLYRVTPLYTEERELEIQQGLPALFQAFDRQNMPFVVDVNRKSVV